MNRRLALFCSALALATSGCGAIHRTVRPTELVKLGALTSTRTATVGGALVAPRKKRVWLNGEDGERIAVRPGSSRVKLRLGIADPKNPNDLASVVVSQPRIVDGVLVAMIDELGLRYFKLDDVRTVEVETGTRYGWEILAGSLGVGLLTLAIVEGGAYAQTPPDMTPTLVGIAITGALATLAVGPIVHEAHGQSTQAGYSLLARLGGLGVMGLGVAVGGSSGGFEGLRGGIVGFGLGLAGLTAAVIYDILVLAVEERVFVHP